MSFPSPHKHLIEVEIICKVNNFNQPIILQLACWRPGRYEMQNYAKNIIALKFKNRKGQSVDYKSVSTHEWQISPKDNEEIHITYKFYAKQPDAGGSWFKSDLIYLNFINFLMYEKDKIYSEEHSIELKINVDLPISSPLIWENKNEKIVCQNVSFGTLADSPFLASMNLKKHQFELNQIKFHLSFWGNISPNFEKLETDFSKFIQHQIQIFGEFPEAEYHFQFLIPPFEHYHGVEHSKSTVIVLGKDSDFEDPIFYKKLLGISSHEFFHAWNICKIRPQKLLPYDFSKAQYFEEGFVAEGVTTYYGDLSLLQSGVWSFETYSKELAENIENHLHNSAKNSVSFLDTATILWTDGYQKTHPFRKVSIYDKGAIAAFILDVKIRMHSQNAKSLNDVMQKMWLDFGKKIIGYNYEKYKVIAEEVALVSMQKYFDEIIAGTYSLENYLAACMDYLGLEMVFLPSEYSYENIFGFKVNHKNMIIAIANGSPADSNLDIDDEIIKINGLKISQNNFYIPENQIVELEINSFGEINTKRLVATGGFYFPKIYIRKKANITDLQKCNFDSFCNI